MGDQDIFYSSPPDLLHDFPGFGGRVDDDGFPGLRAGDKIAVVFKSADFQSFNFHFFPKKYLWPQRAQSTQSFHQQNPKGKNPRLQKTD
jgi:hypothetical protein